MPPGICDRLLGGVVDLAEVDAVVEGADFCGLDAVEADGGFADAVGDGENLSGVIIEFVKEPPFEPLEASGDGGEAGFGVGDDGGDVGDAGALGSGGRDEGHEECAVVAHICLELSEAVGVVANAEAVNASGEVEFCVGDAFFADEEGNVFGQLPEQWSDAMREVEEGFEGLSVEVLEEEQELSF
jgi:hypothetical protein